MTPKPLVQSTVARVDEIEIGACHQDNVPLARQYDVPLTPMAPVSAEDLVSLQNLIKQDAHTLNEASI